MTNNDDNWFNSLINKYRRKEQTQQLTEQQIRELKEKLHIHLIWHKWQTLTRPQVNIKFLSFATTMILWAFFERSLNVIQLITNRHKKNENRALLTPSTTVDDDNKTQYIHWCVTADDASKQQFS